MVVKKEKYLSVSQEQYEKLMERYNQFIAAINDPNKEPISPYKPLSKKLLEELELIREVSRELQKKKVEDINKAAQAAKEAEEAAAKKEAEVSPQEEKVE